MVVEFSKQFIKELKKHFSKSEAKKIVVKLSITSPSDGDYVARISNIIIREKKLKTSRFYFITEDDKKHIITKIELRELIIKFVALSKKNNQQKVIDKLKEDLNRFGFQLS